MGFRKVLPGKVLKGYPISTEDPNAPPLVFPEGTEIWLVRNGAKIDTFQIRHREEVCVPVAFTDFDEILGPETEL